MPPSLVSARVSWPARITEFAWNSHFCDEQIKGPFEVFRHRHGIEAEVRDEVEGTVVSDRIEFELPFGIVGTSGAKVKRQLEESFVYRQKRLPEILAAASKQAARRA